MPYIGQLASGNSKIKKHAFTANASQVDFSVASNAGDELQVFLNGVLLKETDDYTYTTSTVSLGTGATVSDIVEVHVYQSFVVADAVKASGDTMTGELEVPTVKLSSNVIKASDGGSTLTLDTSDNVSIGGDLTVTGGDIKSSGGTTAISVSGANATLAGNLVIPDGGNIGSASDTDAIAIASDGGLTFSGGIDNAGTISAGTFNGTVGDSATFPSHHVIKTSHATYASAVNITSITKASGTSTGLTISHQALSASNYLYFWVNIMYKITTSSNYGGFGFEVHDGSSIVYTDAATATIFFNGLTNDARIRPFYHFRINPANADNITYDMRAFKNASAQTLTAQNESSPSSVTIFEVKA